MTRQRTWASDDRRFIVVLSERAGTEMRKLLKSAKRTETGGLLIGWYDRTLRTATIDEVTGPPSDSRAGPTWFARGTARLAELLARRWRQATPTYYLGEWHYHPVSIVEPSTEDLDQMRKIAGDAAYFCPEPVMLIAGIASDHERPMRLFVHAGPSSIELREE